MSGLILFRRNIRAISNAIEPGPIHTNTAIQQRGQSRIYVYIPMYIPRELFSAVHFCHCRHRPERWTAEVLSTTAKKRDVGRRANLFRVLRRLLIVAVLNGVNLDSDCIRRRLRK